MALKKTNFDYWDYGTETSYLATPSVFTLAIPFDEGSDRMVERARDEHRRVLHGIGHGPMLKTQQLGEGGIGPQKFDFDQMAQLLYGIFGDFDSAAEGTTGLTEYYYFAAPEPNSGHVRCHRGGTLWTYKGYVMESFRIEFPADDEWATFSFDGHSRFPELATGSTALPQPPQFLGLHSGMVTAVVICGVTFTSIFHSATIEFLRPLMTNRWGSGGRLKSVPNDHFAIRGTVTCLWDDPVYTGGASGTGALEKWRSLGGSAAIGETRIDFHNGITSPALDERSGRILCPSTNITSVEFERANSGVIPVTIGWEASNGTIVANGLGAQSGGTHVEYVNTPGGVRLTLATQS